MKLIREDYNILELNGDIVFENSNQVKTDIKEILKKHDIKEIILDISGVTFVDSSGIGVFISIFKFIREKNGKMALAGPKQKVYRVFELTRIDQIIDIYDSVKKAEEIF